MREKLIELIQSAVGGCSTYWAGLIADHLITNGVTIGKPLTEYLHPIDLYEGLKEKFLVFKADTGERVVNCFVLRPGKDIVAVEALRAYANATDNKKLAQDIYSWVGKEPMTNADSFRAMSDEEFARELHAVVLGWAEWCDHHCANWSDDGCDKCILKWLQQPAKGE